MKAMIVNRIGDFGYALGIFAIYSTFKTLDFETVFALAPYLNNESFIILGLEINKIYSLPSLSYILYPPTAAIVGIHQKRHHVSGGRSDQNILQLLRLPMASHDPNLIIFPNFRFTLSSRRPRNFKQTRSTYKKSLGLLNATSFCQTIYLDISNTASIRRLPITPIA